MSPAEVRQVGGQPAGRGAECGWDGAGKCTPGLDSPGQQSSSRAGASTGRKREQCGRWGVLSAPDARRLGFSVVHSTSDCVQPSSRFNFDLLKD